MMQFRTVLLMTIAVLVLGTAGAAARQVHPNMLNSRLAEVKLKSRLDIQAVQEIGGIFDHYDGRMHKVYLLPEDFETLRMRGMDVRWLTEDEIDPTGMRHRPSSLDEYHENADIEADFIALQAAYPTLFSYESIGLSVQGRDLWVAKLSDYVTVDEPEIEVKYISSMHGDEIVGVENCMKFIDTLLTGYGTDPELTQLMENFEIWIMPLMNPDGRAAGALGQRWNANGVDLNRDFPDRVDDSTNTTLGRAQETALVMNWSATRNFVISANFHGGALVANYPFDNNYAHASVYTATAEDPLFIQISLAYSIHNNAMYTGSFPNGITNGADWYDISGGMQDWNYVWIGDKDVTIELSDTKSGPESALDSLWRTNDTSMRYYLLEAEEGVRGLVTDASSGNPVRAHIQLESISYLTYGSALHGEYFRMLQPGTYQLTFSAPGYDSQVFNSVTVVAGTPTVLDVQLNRVPSPEISVDPDSIASAVAICGETDVPLTIYNTGAVTLNWSAHEQYQNPGGLWRHIDSDDASGPGYAWRDIDAVGTTISFSSDDQNLGPYSIGFTFPFYGQNFTTYRISANGWISFTSSEAGQPSYSNQSLPDAARPENMIAAWWDDLSPQRAGASVMRYTSGSDSLIITYDNVESFSGGGLYTFQFILLADGKIVFQYRDMGAARLDEATIGVQNGDQTKGLTIIHNESYMHDLLAIDLCPGNSVELVPSLGSVPPQSQQVVAARLNSCCLPDGLNYTVLEIESDDPAIPVLSVPVTLNVGAPTEPDPVVDLTATVEGSSIRLSWNAAAGAGSYEVWKGTSPDFDTGSGTLLATTADTTNLDSTLILEGAEFYFVISLP